MDDMPFGLTRQTTYAKLSPEDLESMGKQAATAYLTKRACSLNEAVVKVAKCHPSISTHQVQRVIEFANQETFSRLFADNEKYASDKNISFPLADPGVILHDLNDGAKPQMLQPEADDYHCGPVKTAAAASAVEADLALTKMFLGVDLASPHSEKTAAMVVKVNEDGTLDATVDRILSSGEKTAGAVADRILAAGEDGARPFKGNLETSEDNPSGGEATYDEAAQTEKVAMGGPSSVMMNAQPQPQQHPEVTHRENMRQLERRVELEKKKQELVAMHAKGMQAAGDQGGAPAPTGQEQAAPPAPSPMAAAPGQGPQANAPAPPAAEQPKMASAITKEAVAYAKAGRPRSAQVLDDLRQATSFDNIKVAARAASHDYPMANPHGELIRAKHKVARLLEDAVAAKHKNEYLCKEANSRFNRAVVQFFHDSNGQANMGEVVHLMAHSNDNQVLLKAASEGAVAELARHGFDPVQLQAQTIRYEMAKSASVRTPNPEHPICASFADFCKLAEGQRVLDESHRSLKSKYDEIEGVLKEAMGQNAVAV